MLRLKLDEFVDGDNVYPEVIVELEHSLYSLSKWEYRHLKPFFKRNEERTTEEALDYIMQMVVGEVPPLFVRRLTAEDVTAVYEHVQAEKTATWFREDPNQKPSRETITSELIYSWMVEFRIPPEYQYWHLSRLMTLIKILGIRQAPPKKMSQRQQMDEMRRLNAERKKQLGTTG